MTRTSRSASLRSVLKDRSESKTGLNNNLRKNGGGAHNWGSLENEVRQGVVELASRCSWSRLHRSVISSLPVSTTGNRS